VTAESRERFAAAVRAPEPDLALACLLIGCEVAPDLDVGPSLARLDALAADLGEELPAGGSAYDQAVAVRRLLGDREGFRGYGDDFGDLRASLLHEVLERRRGLPILLSVVYLEVARRAGAAAYGIGLPGHFVVGVGDRESPLVLDPYTGGRLTTLAELADRVPGDTRELTPADLVPWHPVEIVARVLNNIRVLSARTGDVRTRLWAADLALLLPSHHVELRRERGELRARLGDYLGAASDLELYADALSSVDEERADQALSEARMVRARLN
jgi:regulator of sirC expression with transglutaminase-like and TPR domain